MSLETQLRDALTARADDLDGPAFDPYERVAGAVVTSRRRRRAAAVGAVAAVAAVAVLVPALGQGGDRSTLPSKRTQVVVPGPADPRWDSMSTWPTRGGLATDTAFLRSVEVQFSTAHVLYAADLPTSRVVVTWEPVEGSGAKLTMLSGRRGASAQDLSEVSSYGDDPTGLVALREHADNDSTLVVLTTPRTTSIGISRNVQIAPDGSVAREAFRTVTAKDGLYSALLEDSPSFLTRVRLGTGPSTRLTLTGRQSLDLDDRGSICLSCTGEEFRREAEKAMGGGVAVKLGLSPEDVTTTTRYYGPVAPGVAEGLVQQGSGSAARLIVTDSTLAGGQVLRSAFIVSTQKDGSGSSVLELSDGAPIDAATAGLRPFVLAFRGLGQEDASAQVFAPGAASVRLLSSNPTIHPSSSMLEVVDGTAVTTPKTWRGGQTSFEVATYDAGGRELGRWPLDLPLEDRWTEGQQP